VCDVDAVRARYEAPSPFDRAPSGRRSVTGRRIARLATLVAVGSVVLGACSADGSTCSAIDDLRASAENLVDEETLQGGVDDIEAAIDEVGDDLADIGDAAHEEFEAEVDQVSGALDEVRDSVSDVDRDDTREDLGQVGDAADQLGDVAGDLKDRVAEVGSGC
jgi:hypothetical protein